MTLYVQLIYIIKRGSGINSYIEMANKNMYEQLLVEEVLNFQKSVSCEFRFEYKLIDFFSGFLCNF